LFDLLHPVSAARRRIFPEGPSTSASIGNCGWLSSDCVVDSVPCDRGASTAPVRGPGPHQSRPSRFRWEWTQESSSFELKGVQL